MKMNESLAGLVTTIIGGILVVIIEHAIIVPALSTTDPADGGALAVPIDRVDWIKDSPYV